MTKLQTSRRYRHKKFIGKVLSNQDPLELYRIKIMVPGIFDGYTIDQLPWAIPEGVMGIGETGAANFCYVPVAGAAVAVEFQDGDPHFPMYSGSVLLKGALNPLFQTNYPNRFGWVDPNGNHFFVDMATNDIEIHHKAGTVAHINPDGSGTINFVGTINSSAPQWNHTGPMKITGNFNVVGNSTLDGDLDVTGVSTLA